MRASLALEMRPGEIVELGDGISLTLEEKTGKVARIRIEAPTDVKIQKKGISPGVREAMRTRGVLKT